MMQFCAGLEVKGEPRTVWIHDERDFEDLIRKHLGDDAANLFRDDIVGEVPRVALREKLQELNSRIGEALDALGALHDADDIIDDVLDELED